VTTRSISSGVISGVTWPLALPELLMARENAAALTLSGRSQMTRRSSAPKAK
jgi:hypothetical protein